VDVLEQVIEHVSKHRKPSQGLVVCGHSLGGGYAQLAALELLQHDNSKFSPSAVVTFGSPLVIVPDPGHEHRDTWEALDAMCLSFINSYDPVPRMLGSWWVGSECSQCRQLLIHTLPDFL
jgi:pimeloyl-ACP methyl ester carboxylesterase